MSNDLFLAAGGLLIPFFINDIKANRQDLILGLMLSLFFWGKFFMPLSLVSLGASLLLYLQGKSNSDLKPKSINCPILYSSAYPLLIIFLCAFSFFIASTEGVSSYSLQFGRSSILKDATIINNIGAIISPIFFAIVLEKKGVLFSTILLSLMGEISVSLLAYSSYNIFFCYASTFTYAVTVSGYFLIFPALISVLFGKVAFKRSYISLSIFSFAIIFCSLILQQQFTLNYKFSGEFLVSLIILSCGSALVLYLAWQKRFVIISDFNGIAKRNMLKSK